MYDDDKSPAEEAQEDMRAEWFREEAQRQQEDEEAHDDSED